MNCQQKSFKISLAVVFGIVALSFVKAGMDNSVTHSRLTGNSVSCFTRSAPVLPNVMPQVLPLIQTNSEPLAYLFQIVFILFIISPPIIVVMLFLIWKELKKRSELK